MITFMIFIALLLALVGLFVVHEAIKNAATGYQDEFGFHEGIDPQHEIDFGSEMIGAPRPKKSILRARQLSKPTVRGAVGHESAAPFTL